ncbi:hypothetical protein HF086_013071 [Spodoptera exigua]|uniref:Uncharacterized protein n=1 Tax=Spodoptera exigua TaxID=7107 RepID=A0A922SBK2_SPOEX|nr:hypothetical protein HF086_013071 [Spodoptera exigua]
MSKYNTLRVALRVKLVIFIVLSLMGEIKCRITKGMVHKQNEVDANLETTTEEEEDEEPNLFRLLLEDPQMHNPARYTPQSFHYVNFQDYDIDHPGLENSCIDQYLKCVISV